MDYFRQNKEKIIKYLANGCKTWDTPLLFGVELEHFVVDSVTKQAVSYVGEAGVEAILKEMIPLYEETVYSDGHLIALGREGIALSLEPAAQLEVSISPKENIDSIREIYQKFMEEIRPILDKYSYELMTVGYQPKSKVQELSLLPKARYRYMDAYFEKIGPYGRQMMRGTASTQVSIDYYSEEDFVRKYKVAYALKDVLAYLCSNSPIYEGDIYHGHNLRDAIWMQTDKERVDVSPYLQAGTMSFENYADFVLNTPVIVNKEGKTECYDERRIGDIARERVFTDEETAHVLSMVFPMIRAKNFLELRFADSMPIEKVLSYVLMIKGLFLDVEATEAWVFTDVFTGLSLRERVKYVIEQVMQKVSAEEKEYLKENRLPQWN